MHGARARAEGPGWLRARAACGAGRRAPHDAASSGAAWRTARRAAPSWRPLPRTALTTGTILGLPHLLTSAGRALAPLGVRRRVVQSEFGLLPAPQRAPATRRQPRPHRQPAQLHPCSPRPRQSQPRPRSHLAAARGPCAPVCLIDELVPHSTDAMCGAAAARRGVARPVAPSWPPACDMRCAVKRAGHSMRDCQDSRLGSQAKGAPRARPRGGRRRRRPRECRRVRAARGAPSPRATLAVRNALKLPQGAPQGLYGQRSGCCAAAARLHDRSACRAVAVLSFGAGPAQHTGPCGTAAGTQMARATLVGFVGLHSQLPPLQHTCWRLERRATTAQQQLAATPAVSKNKAAAPAGAPRSRCGAPRRALQAQRGKGHGPTSIHVGRRSVSSQGVWTGSTRN